MSKVPELRFDGFVGEWEEVQLGTEADVRDGTHDSPKYVNKGYPLITSKNIVNGKLNFNDISFISEEDFFLINKRSKVDIGDIIMPMIGTIGNPTILNRDDFAIKNVALIKKSNNLNNQFLLNLLNSKVFSRYLYIENAGGTQKFIALGMIREFLFNRPNIEEQEKIGNLFRKIDDLIEIQEGKVAKMRDYKKSMLQKMFPKKGELVPEIRFEGFEGKWKKIATRNLGEVITGNTPSTNNDEYWSLKKKNIWITPTDIKGSTISDSQRYLSNAGFCKSKKIPAESVLITSIASIGKNTINLIPASINQQINAIIPKNHDSYFIMMGFNANLQRFKSMAGKSATQIINKSTFEDFELEVPVLEEQEKIGQFFKNIDSQIENEKKLLDSYKSMKKSLLQKMFV